MQGNHSFDLQIVPALILSTPEEVFMMRKLISLALIKLPSPRRQGVFKHSVDLESTLNILDLLNVIPAPYQVRGELQQESRRESGEKTTGYPLSRV
jgi:hypothetical protein